MYSRNNSDRNSEYDYGSSSSSQVPAATQLTVLAMHMIRSVLAYCVTHA
jgi:hypothetical protein